MLMDACEGLSNAERRAAHIRAGKAAAIAGKTPTVRDLIDGLAVIRGRRVDMGPIPHEDELVEQINARFGPTAAADGRPDCKASMLAVGGECPICQTALTSCPFDAECAPPLGAGHLTLELWAKKLTTRHMAYLDSHPMFRDELEDLRTQAGRLQQAALDGVRLMKAAEPSVVLESAYDAARPVADVVEALEGTPPTTGDDPDWVAPAREPSSCGRSWDEAGSPVTRDAALAELQRLGQEFDAAAREFGDLGWMSPIIDAAKDLSLGELEHLVETLENPQEPKDAPNSAEPHPSADACETGSSASPAASELTPDGIEIHHPVKCSGPMRIQADLSRDVWDMSASPSAPVAPSLDLETAYGADLDVIAAEQFDVRRTPGETDSSLRAFLRAKQRADDDLSGCRWVNPVATATDPAADRADLARVTPAALRSADLSGAWRGIAGSQAVEAGGRLPAVAIDKPIQD
jgi:hypothetical protein